MDVPWLSPETARQLNSREISKVLGPLVTGLLQWNRAEDIATALEIWHRIVSDPARVAQIHRMAGYAVEAAKNGPQNE